MSERWEYLWLRLAINTETANEVRILETQQAAAGLWRAAAGG